MLEGIINTRATEKGKLCGLSTLVSGRVSAFMRPYGPCTQADTQPDTHVDNPRRIPFSVGFVYKCNYQSDCHELIYNNLTLIATEIYIPYYNYGGD